MKRHRWALTALAVSVLFAPVLTGAAEPKAEAYFKGKNITFIIPYSPGGGYDLYPRMIIPTLEQYVGASILPDNKPGGGALIGTNGIFNAKPDGLTMGIINGTGMTLSQMTQQKGVSYDMGRFTLLGRIAAEEEYIFVGSKSPYKDLQALLASGDKQTKWVTEGKAGSPYYRLALVLDVLKLHKAKILTGYPGSAEANLAIVRGDADGTAGTYASRQAQVKAGDFIPVLILGKKRSADFPNVPTIYEVAGLEAGDRKMIDFLVGMDQLGRIVAAPPGIDPERAAFLRTALKNVCEDREMEARAKKENRDLNYASPEEVAQMIQDVLQAPPDVKKRVDEALKRFE